MVRFVQNSASHWPPTVPVCHLLAQPVHSDCFVTVHVAKSVPPNRQHWPTGSLGPGDGLGLGRGLRCASGHQLVLQALLCCQVPFCVEHSACVTLLRQLRLLVPGPMQHPPNTWEAQTLLSEASTLPESVALFMSFVLPLTFASTLQV